MKKTVDTISASRQRRPALREMHICRSRGPYPRDFYKPQRLRNPVQIPESGAARPMRT